MAAFHQEHAVCQFRNKSKTLVSSSRPQFESKNNAFRMYLWMVSGHAVVFSK